MNEQAFLLQKWQRGDMKREKRHRTKIHRKLWFISKKSKTNSLVAVGEDSPLMATSLSYPHCSWDRMHSRYKWKWYSDVYFMDSFSCVKYILVIGHRSLVEYNVFFKLFSISSFHRRRNSFVGSQPQTSNIPWFLNFFVSVVVGLPIQPFPEWYENKIHIRGNLIKTTSLEECERENILIEIEILY